jgi:hypothetical protein
MEPDPLFPPNDIYEQAFDPTHPGYRLRVCTPIRLEGLPLAKSHVIAVRREQDIRALDVWLRDRGHPPLHRDLGADAPFYSGPAELLDEFDRTSLAIRSYSWAAIAEIDASQRAWLLYCYPTGTHRYPHEENLPRLTLLAPVLPPGETPSFLADAGERHTPTAPPPTDKRSGPDTDRRPLLRRFRQSAGLCDRPDLDNELLRRLVREHEDVLEWYVLEYVGATRVPTPDQCARHKRLERKYGRRFLRSLTRDPAGEDVSRAFALNTAFLLGRLKSLRWLAGQNLTSKSFAGRWRQHLGPEFPFLSPEDRD